MVSIRSRAFIRLALTLLALASLTIPSFAAPPVPVPPYDAVNPDCTTQTTFPSNTTAPILSLPEQVLNETNPWMTTCVDWPYDKATTKADGATFFFTATLLTVGRSDTGPLSNVAMWFTSPADGENYTRELINETIDMSTVVSSIVYMCNVPQVVNYFYTVEISSVDATPTPAPAEVPVRLARRAAEMTKRTVRQTSVIETHTVIVNQTWLQPAHLIAKNVGDSISLTYEGADIMLHQPRFAVSVPLSGGNYTFKIAYEYNSEIGCEGECVPTVTVNAVCGDPFVNDTSIFMAAQGTNPINVTVSTATNPQVVYFYLDIPGDDVKSVQVEVLAIDAHTPTPSPTSTPGPKSAISSDCFPASSRVTLESGEDKMMRELQIGDVVAVGNGKFSPVYFFSHRVASGQFTFVGVHTDKGKAITLSRNHYLLVDGRLVSASAIEVGDKLKDANGNTEVVTAVEQGVPDTGLYNPHTLDDTIVVDGIEVSVFTSSALPAIARLLLAPLKLAYRLGLQKMLEGIWDDGKPVLARWMINGSPKIAM